MSTIPNKNLTEIYSERKISFKILILVGVGWWRVGNHQLRNCSTSWEGAKLLDEGKLCRAFHFIARALNEILTKEIHELNQFDFVWFFVFLWFHLISASVWCCGRNWKEQNKMSQNVEQLHFQICQKDIFYKNESKHTNKPFLKIIHAMQTYFYRKISPTDSLGFLWEREENI